MDAFLNGSLTLVDKNANLILIIKVFFVVVVIQTITMRL